MMRELACTNCHAPLTGGLDTYGNVGDEQCWDCYSEPLLNEPQWVIITSHEELANPERVEGV